MTIFHLVGYVHKQIDERTFEVSTAWSRKGWTIKCYLSHELFRENIRPLVGDRVMLEYNAGLRRIERRRFYIIKVIY